MKRTLITLLAVAVIATAFAAAATYTKQNTRIMREQCDVTYDATGALVAANVSAFLQTRLLVNDADPTDVIQNPWKQVSYNLLDPALATTTITAGGTTVTYPKLAALMRQAALDRATAAGVQ